MNKIISSFSYSLLYKTDYKLGIGMPKFIINYDLDKDKYYGLMSDNRYAVETNDRMFTDNPNVVKILDYKNIKELLYITKRYCKMLGDYSINDILYRLDKILSLKEINKKELKSIMDDMYNLYFATYHLREKGKGRNRE